MAVTENNSIIPAMAQDLDISFRYNSSLKGRRIRLLYIQPSHAYTLSSALLQISLVEAFLDTADFDALSYVREESSPQFQIRCNGKRFNIGRNLHEALTEAHGRSVDRGLWADAICINQADTTEKNEQVQLMGDIYGAAAHTVIWLGTGLPYDAHGIQLAHSVFSKYNNDDSLLKPYLCSNADFDYKAQGIPELLHGNDVSPPWKALFKILSHPWFSCVWTIPELMMSSALVAWRGTRIIETNALIWMAYHVGSKRTIQTWFDAIHGYRSYYLAVIAQFYYSVNLRHNHQRPSIGTNLYNSVGMQAADLRDRIFAIATISENLPINFVNYSRTLGQVVTQVALLSFMDGPQPNLSTDIDVLADYPSTRLLNKTIQMPSWAPDFFADQLRGVSFCHYYPTKTIRDCNKGLPVAELRVTIEASDGTLTRSIPPKLPYLYHKVRELQISGTVLDRILSIMPLTDLIKNEKTEATPTVSSSAESLSQSFINACQYSDRVIGFINRARLLAEPELRNCDITSGKTYDAFWRTLLYNRAGFESEHEVKPDSNIGISFGYWYLMLKVISMARWNQDTGLYVLYSLALRPLAHPFKSIFDQIHSSRCFFVSDKGRIGWAPTSARCGDSLAIFQGSRIPFATRLLSEDTWEYIGGCYVHGCMDGEIWNEAATDWKYLSFV